MEHFIQRAVRNIAVAMVTKKYQYYVTTILLLSVTTTDSFKEGWNWKPTIPTKLLAWPIRASIVILFINPRCPSFPRNNWKHILLVLYLQVAVNIMLGLHVRLHCSFSPQYCYEGYQRNQDDENLATSLTFFGFQVIITSNILYAIWFIKSIRRVIAAAIIGFIKFLIRDALIVSVVGNFVVMVSLLNVQNVVIVALIIWITCQFAMDFFLIHPIIEYMAADIPLFFDDYEIDGDDFNAARNPQANHPFGRGFRFIYI